MKKSVLCLVIMLLLSASCLINRLEENETTIYLQKNRNGTPITIKVTKGPHWTNIHKMGPFKANVLPQIVVWIERRDAKFIDTLYITGAYSKPKSHMGKLSKGTLFWKEYFPAWSVRMVSADKKLPLEENADFDAVTSATPQSSFTLNTKLLSNTEPFVLYVELNKSTDTNAVFTEENYEWVGQPSIIYSCEIASTKGGIEYTLKPIGYGDINKENSINHDLTNIDTALKIIKEIKVSF